MRNSGTKVESLFHHLPYHRGLFLFLYRGHRVPGRLCWKSGGNDRSSEKVTFVKEMTDTVRVRDGWSRIRRWNPWVLQAHAAKGTGIRVAGWKVEQIETEEG